MNKKFSLTLFYAIICANCLYAQKVLSILGVVDLDNGKAASGATIRVPKNLIGILCDTAGRFTIDNVPDGSLLICSSVGYRSDTEIVKGNNYFKITLHPNIKADVMEIIADSARSSLYAGKRPVQHIVSGDPNRIFTMVEIEARFPGGMNVFNSKLKRLINYPDSAIANKIQGEVKVGFTISKSGEVIDPVLIKGIDSHIDSQVLAAVVNAGYWVPALQNGHYVETYKEVTIEFKIPD